MLEEEIASVLRGELVIDCGQMTLTARGSSDHKYAGAGSIRQNGLGTLEFICYDPQYTPGAADLERYTVHTPGEWLPEESYYDLTGLDGFGRTWRAEWIRPDPSSTFGQPGVVVRGRLRSVTTDEDGQAGVYRLSALSPDS
jgi:hypothetical protein